MNAWALALGALVGVAPARPPQRSSSAWMSLAPAARDATIEAARSLSFHERLESMTEMFLGTPYALSPLGEGEGKDPDPLIRYDAVDCLTFVEEAIALSVAEGPTDVVPMLAELRYGKSPTYDDRNHLMEAEWIPQNLAKGFLVDVTQRYGGEDAVQIEKEVTAQTWASRSASALGLPPARQAVGRFPLWIVPLERARDRLSAAPTGTVVVVVREDRPLLVTRVSHLGFLIHKQGKTYLRHASNTFGRVVDEDMESFLVRNARYAKWKVTGLSLYEVNKPTAAPLPEL